MTSESTDILADLMDASGRGDAVALDKLFSMLYTQLWSLAHARLRHSAELTLIDTTALVNESFLRCVESQATRSLDRQRFLGYASRVMRSVIIDYVRERRAERHGGLAHHLPLDTELGEQLAALSNLKQK